MKKNCFYYFITPFGVISFSKKYVFINGSRTKSFVRLVRLLQKFDPVLFSWRTLSLYWSYNYDEVNYCLHRYLNTPELHKVRVTKVYEAGVHSTSQIYHGQFSYYPPKCVELAF